MSESVEDHKQHTNNLFQLSVGNILSSMLNQFEDEQLIYTTKKLDNYFYFKWDKRQSVEWNVYKFSDSLSLFKRACKRLEEQHGFYCTDESVRDKYLMPKIKAFTAILTSHVSKK